MQISEKRVRELSLAHAKKQLGDEQFANNKPAARAIMEDFEAGISAALQLMPVFAPNRTDGRKILLDATVFPSEEKTIVCFPTDDKFHGAHNYEVKPMLRFEPGVGAVYGLEGMPLTFVKKNDDGTWQPGLQSEHLLLLLIDRHNKMNAVFPSKQHDYFIGYLESALGSLQVRVTDRQERGVMGEHKA